MDDNKELYSCMIQHIRIGPALTREEFFELGRRGPYHRYITFPELEKNPDGTFKGIVAEYENVLP